MYPLPKHRFVAPNETSPKSSIEQKQYFLLGVCAQPLSNGPFLETEEDFWVGPMPGWSFCLLFH